jgi:hypothetical protein
MPNHIKAIHRYWGIGSAIFLLLLSLTGILLHHPGWFSGTIEETLSIAIDPADPHHLLRGTTSGLFQSHDGGVTWSETDMLLPAEKVVGIAFSSDIFGRVYVALRDLGLIRSDDAGRIWESIALPFVPVDAGIEIHGIAIAPKGGIFLSTSRGLLVSLNGGVTWDWRSRTKEERTFYQIVHSLHTGYFLRFLLPASLSPLLLSLSSLPPYIYDIAAVGLLILIFTGFSLYYRKKANETR